MKLIKFLSMLIAISTLTMCTPPDDGQPPQSDNQYTIDDDRVIYNWIDTSSGTDVSLGDNSSSGAVAIGFPFSFYGTEYSEVYIHSNGFISFSSDTGTGMPAQIPSSSAPNAVIAGLWTDLDPSSGGPYIDYITAGEEPDRCFALSYSNIPLKDSAQVTTFQIILFESANKIEIQYSDFNSSGNSTIGVENAAGTSACFREGENFSALDLPDDTAILFSPN